ncbi:MAG: ion transporter [Flavobacteriales bacterium]|nr:ion transporter [Flavobacteriales bacterium]
MKESLKSQLHEIIFEADTPKGKAFDVLLLVAIVLSVLAVMLESVESIEARYGTILKFIEWLFTGLFTLEYILRVFLTKKPLRYIFSFFGLVDLFSIVPTYLGIIIPHNTASLATIRSLRLLRVFRVLKLARYVGGARVIIDGLRASRPKIIVFLTGVIAVSMIMGTIMYLVEGKENGFSSIPRSIYWAIVTLTTVGYGDISPVTPIGQTLASFLMIMGYGIIAVPTGLVTADIINANKKRDSNDDVNTQVCSNCNFDQHDTDAKFCKKCGEDLIKK